jgi:CheY-like chemotaxis protein
VSAPGEAAIRAGGFAHPTPLALENTPLLCERTSSSVRVTTDRPAFPILIVEDDEPTQNLLRAVLRKCGHASEVASNGREAIAVLQEKQYAAVILDIMMPEVGGREVADYLGRTPESPPVIICSAATGPAALSGFNPQVVKAIVRKPFDIDQLIAAVTAVTDAAK